MATILLVDDDAALLEILSEYLQRFDHRISTATTGAECLERLVDSQFNLVVLGVNIPGIDGWQTLSEVRASSDVPVIMLTARTEERDVLKGFGLGADDYVAKPFSFAQFEARIRAVLARGSGRGRVESRVLTAGSLSVDLDAHRVTRDGVPIKLTPTEFRLLVTLMEQPNKVLSPKILVRRVWGDEYESESDYVRRYIWYLRQKLETSPDEPEYIRNERNMGYYFAAGSAVS
jgi:two-component system KDP operon response regulator KdpE